MTRGLHGPALILAVAAVIGFGVAMGGNPGLEASDIFVKELITIGKVTIVDIKDADAWFEGVLRRYDKAPISYGADQEILERRVVITAEVTFQVKGEEEPFYYEETVRGKAEYRVTDDLALDDQSEREAALEALADLASRVISEITEGF